MGIWIDERGRVVRPAEPAWTTNQTLKIGGKSITTEGEPYVAALARLGEERRAQLIRTVR